MISIKLSLNLSIQKTSETLKAIFVPLFFATEIDFFIAEGSQEGGSDQAAADSDNKNEKVVDAEFEEVKEDDTKQA